MGNILDFTNWKRLNEEQTTQPWVALNNAISKIKDGDTNAIKTLVSNYKGIKNVLYILGKAGLDQSQRYDVASKIRDKYGYNSTPADVSAALDEFAEEDWMETVERNVKSAFKAERQMGSEKDGTRFTAPGTSRGAL